MASSGREILDSSSSTLDSLLPAVVRLTGAQGGLVRRRVGASGESRLIAAWGVPNDILAFEYSIGGPCGICGEALRRKCIRIAEPASRRGGVSATESAERACAATVALSLDHYDSNVGVFVLFFGRPGRLRNEFIGLLRPVSRLLAFAVKSSALQDDRTLSSEHSDAISGSLSGEDGVLFSPTSRQSAPTLTRREREVLEQIASGKNNKEIARMLGMSHDTVKSHVRHIFAKLGFSSRTQAALHWSKQ